MGGSCEKGAEGQGLPIGYGYALSDRAYHRVWVGLSDRVYHRVWVGLSDRVYP